MPALRRYYRGDELIAMRDVQASTTRYYRFDHQGTTQCLTNEAGAVTDRFAADAWGVEVKRTGSSINRHWYIGSNGYYGQSTSALQYVRWRYLQPRYGSWISRDPLSALDGTSARLFNALHPQWVDPFLIPNSIPTIRSRNAIPDAFVYALNSAALRIDPSGLQCPKLVQCPDPCDRTSSGKKYTGPGKLDCNRAAMEHDRIQWWCKQDVLGNQVPRFQADTTCCCHDHCGVAYWTGCTVVSDQGATDGENFFELPQMLQLCVHFHEGRRACICKNTEGEFNGGYLSVGLEVDRVLDCLRNLLQSCNLKPGWCLPKNTPRTFNCATAKSFYD